MKKLVYLSVVVSLMLALFPVVASAHTADAPFVTDLIAGGGNPASAIDVGDVLVWNDGDTLYIKYVITDYEWCITETHLQVATSPDDIPQKKGNPIPGHFEENDEHGRVTEVLYTYSLTERGWAMDDELYIAAHAVVVRPVDSCYEQVKKPCEQWETAWGAGFDFPGKNWATYLEYTVQGEMPVEWPEGGTLSVAYEDLPITPDSDYDYNDWVADIDTLATFWGTTAHRDLLKIDFTIIPEARGAWYGHVFHMLIPENTFECNGSSTLIIYDEGGNVFSQSTAAFNASIDNDFVVIPLTKVAFPGDQQVVNTDEDMDYVPPQRTADLSIVFDALCPFDFNAYDPNDPANIHGEGLFFDPWLHVIDTGDDIHREDPRMLAVPVDWMWPEERVNIWLAYPDVTSGNPPTFTEYWWLNYNDLVYNGKP